MEKTSAIILAAGEGKRMNSKTPKVLCEVLEKPLIDWVIKASINAKIEKKCVVLGNKAEYVKKYIENTHKNEDIYFSFQQKQKGTADAVKSATNFLQNNYYGDVFICCADAPLLDEKTIKDAYTSHKEKNAAVTTISANIKNPKGLGRILRDKNQKLIKIVEEKDATTEELKITEVNSGAYWFNIKELLEILNEINSKNAQCEYYLTDAINILYKKNKNLNCFITKNEYVILGANTRLELLKINEIAKNKIIEDWAENGVNFISTEGVLIYPEVVIKKNTTILPGSILKGKTTIGENCIIGPNSLIENSVVENNCKINASQIYNSQIARSTTIGPFSHIRPNSKIANNVKIGDFVEIKNSEIGAGSSISHLTYVGDSDVGKNVNFGCGVVTINYDGVKKSRCTISDGAFIGCNTNLVAPVKLGKNAYTAAGSTITKDVPEEALAIERTKQIIIKDFSKNKLKNRKLKIKD